MDRQQKAIIQMECQQLLNRVTMLTDDGQWDELATCYTSDAVLFRPSDSTTGIEGRAAILESFKARPPRVSCHVLANTVFEILAPDKESPEKVTAKSRIWLMTGESSENLPVKAESKLMVGSFLDTLVLVNNEWLIASRRGSIELKYSYE